MSAAPVPSSASASASSSSSSLPNRSRSLSVAGWVVLRAVSSLVGWVEESGWVLDCALLLSSVSDSSPNKSVMEGSGCVMAVGVVADSGGLVRRAHWRLTEGCSSELAGVRADQAGSTDSSCRRGERP